MNSRHHAFTFIEILIVIVIIAILSVALSLAFLRLKGQTEFNNQKTEIVNMIQKARSLSLSNILINDTEPTKYYKLTLEADEVTIDAYAYDETTHDTLEILTLKTGMSFGTTVEVFYFPPYGDVCFTSASCVDTDTSKSTTLTNSSTGLTATFTIDVNGGYVNVD